MPRGLRQTWPELYKFECRAHYRYLAGRINDDMFRMRAIAEKDLQKLVSPYGVARSVAVIASYLGRGVASLDVEIIGTSGETYNVGVTGSRLENGWVWK
jgi:hypothetical protein